jgi:MFS family permease
VAGADSGEGSAAETSIEAIRTDAGRWRFLPALASPLYRRFMAGALVTNLGTWMQQTAQGWLVLTLTNSPALLGVTSAAANLPILLFSLHAGALADRVDLRRLLVASRLAAAGVTAVLALVTMLGIVQFWQVVAVAFLVGVATAVASPAYQAVMSSLVEPRMLGNAIALNSAQFNLSRIVGPSIAGVAIAAVGVAAAFWANAIGFLFSAATLATIPPARRPAGVHALSLWSNVIAGVRFVRRDPIVLTLLLLPLAPGILNLNYLVLLPVFARDVLEVGAPGLGLMTAAVGVGAVAGALSIAILRPGGGSGRLVLGGLVASSLGLLVFAISPWLPLSMAGLAVLGGFSTAYYTTTNTLLQLIVPARMRGRVMSLYILSSTGFIPLGNIVAGVAAERVGAPSTLAGMVLITLMVCAFVALRVPSLLALDADAVRARSVAADPMAGGD